MAKYRKNGHDLGANEVDGAAGSFLPDTAPGLDVQEADALFFELEGDGHTVTVQGAFGRIGLNGQLLPPIGSDYVDLVREDGTTVTYALTTTKRFYELKFPHPRFIRLAVTGGTGNATFSGHYTISQV